MSISFFLTGRHLPKGGGSNLCACPVKCEAHFSGAALSRDKIHHFWMDTKPMLSFFRIEGSTINRLLPKSPRFRYQSLLTYDPGHGISERSTTRPKNIIGEVVESVEKIAESQSLSQTRVLPLTSALWRFGQQPEKREYQGVNLRP